MISNLSLGAVSYTLVAFLGNKCVLLLVSWSYSHKFGLLYYLQAPHFLKTIFGILLLDLTAFLWHIANHKNQFLWRFHIAHHSDLVFDTSTAVRFHPGEVFISLFIRSLVIFLFGISVQALVLFECIYLFFNCIEHSNVLVPKQVQEILHPLFISPALHVAHHSRDLNEQNSNYGTIFSIWDRVFRTLFDKEPSTPFEFGVYEIQEPLGVKNLLNLPFQDSLFRN